jgi:hypothetical protein
MEKVETRGDKISIQFSATRIHWDRDDPQLGTHYGCVEILRMYTISVGMVHTLF